MGGDCGALGATVACRHSALAPQGDDHALQALMRSLQFTELHLGHPQFGLLGRHGLHDPVADNSS